MWKVNRILILLILMPVLSYAQLCNGEIGSPVLLETYGRGHNYGPPLPAEATPYEFVTEFPFPGSYMVTNRTQLNGATWHPSLDRTPNDGNGYMLLFDQAEIPGEFYRVLLDSLCPGTRYEFKVWATNVVTSPSCGGESIEPDVRFELRDPVSDNIITSVETGSMPTTPFLRWSEFSAVFTLPQNLDAVRLVVVNQVAGGCGNDIAIDDISLSICNPSRQQSIVLCGGGAAEVNGNVYTEAGEYRDTIPGANFCHDSILITNVRVEAPEVVEVDTFICEGSPFWVGDNTYTEPGFYIDTLTTLSGCDSIVHLQLSPASLRATLTASADSIDLGRSVELQAAGEGLGGLIWSWLPSEGIDCLDCARVVVQPLETTTYALAVKDTLSGCRDTLQKEIIVLPCRSVFAPTAFSPNGDGRNDNFRPLYGDCVVEVSSLSVYNRWGSLVFRSRQADQAWDGYSGNRPCRTGMYVFSAVLLLKDGKEKVVKGEVQLLR